MFVLGITGGIGTGKSTVSKILEERGLLVLDADKISHEVTDVGGVALEEIKAEFGARAIASNGAMDRKYISSKVFDDKMKLDKLSSIVHKYVIETIITSLEKERIRSTKCVVLDVPIPVKHGFIDQCNQIWVVTCDDKVRLERIVNRGSNRDDAQRRIQMQMTNEEYAALGDFEIDNSGTLDELEARVEALIKSELHERGIRI